MSDKVPEEYKSLTTKDIIKNINEKSFSNNKSEDIKNCIIETKEEIVKQQKKLSTENRELYGSVKPTEISKIIKQFEDLEINPSLIQPSKEIKSLGTFDVILNLHSDIQSQIKITVVAQEENQ